jgi:hypothetical protein
MADGGDREVMRAQQRNELATQYLGLAGRVERLRDTDSDHHPSKDELGRWQNLYQKEITVAIDRRNELVDRDTGPGVDTARLTLWLEEIGGLLKVVPSTW